MPGARRVVLIIDDDASVRESLRKVLFECGYAVLLAGDGKEGLAQLKKQRTDLLLLDLNLPKLSGFDLLDIATQRSPLLPIIIMTGMADQCEPGALMGADALVEKPPDVALLLQTIAKLLSEPADQRIHRLSNGRGDEAATISSFPCLPGIQTQAFRGRVSRTNAPSRGLPCES